MAGLEGFCRTHPASRNTAWHNPSFRGYVDYMLTPECGEQLMALIERAGHERIALLCARAVSWHCHRSLIV